MSPKFRKRGRTRPAADPAYEEMRRVGRRRLWRLLGTLVVLAAIGGLAAAAYFSPMMSVRHIDVVGGAETTITGNTANAALEIPREDVLAVADVPMGTPLLQVDTAAIAARVARIPAVSSATVSRDYPSTLTIEVTERRPLVFLALGDGRVGVMDRQGVVYVEFSSQEAMQKAAAGKFRHGHLPELDVPNPGVEDPATMAALEVAGSLPDWLWKVTESISASSPADVRLHLTKGRTVVWGDDQRPVDKAQALSHVLRLPGSTFNVSSPDYPAVS